MTQKNIPKMFIPKKIFIFLKTPKNIEIQKIDPKKWTEPTYVWKYQSTPPPPPGDFPFIDQQWREKLVLLQNNSSI